MFLHCLRHHHHSNHLLSLSIFGSPLFSKLEQYEIAHTTKNQTVIHMFSNERINELLSFGGMSGAIQEKDGAKYFACAKVNLENRDGKNCIAYVMKENVHSLFVKTENNSNDLLIELKRPLYDCKNGCYHYHESGSQEFTITEVWPMRMKINKSGRTSFILNVAIF